MSTISPKLLKLELGDIIQIVAPTNPEFNKQVFYIKYIDNDKIVLIDGETLDEKQLLIKDFALTDESIETIILLNRSKEKGYARQHNLLTETWIDIMFGGDVPTIITGQITNLEDDMIEITIFSTKKVIYIDFGYKGVPITLPIKSITIRNKPIRKIKGTIDITKGDSDVARLPAITEGEEYEYDKEELTPDLKPDDRPVKSLLSNILAEADAIEFGDTLEEITQVVTVSEQEKRFNITNQSEDMLNEMLSKIPTHERTPKVKNNIQRIISRFIELRKEFSLFDKNGVIDGILSHDANYKPLQQSLLHLRNKLYWILPIVKNNRVLYCPPNESATPIVSDNVAFSDYYDNSIIGERNKYYNLIQILNENSKSFNLPNPDVENDILSETTVSTSQPMILNNVYYDDNDLYSNVVKTTKTDKDECDEQEQKFVIMNYITGLTNYTPVKKSTSILTPFKKTFLTQSDIASINSFLMLPEAFVQYSHINLPQTNILKKSNLNMTPLTYFNILNKNTDVNTNIITNINEEYTYSASTFLKEIVHVLSDELITEENKYEKFLNAMIPKTRDLFNLIEKYIQNKTNFADIVNYLEPFLIYHTDLTFMQYKTIVDYININIDKLRTHIETNKKLALTLKNLKIKTPYVESILISMLHNSMLPALTTKNINERKETAIIYDYGIEDEKYTETEKYCKIIGADYGNAYNSAISVIDLNLYSDTNIDATIMALKDKVERLTTDTKEQKIDDKTCSTYELSKRYIEYDELQDDDNKIIYFDNKYDNTQYDIINTYQAERDSMAEPEFTAFLQQQLESNIGLAPEKALIDAKAMILGKKQVMDGHYASLETFNDQGFKAFMYFKRIDNKWVFDEELSSQISAQESSNSVFCNSAKKCIMSDNECEKISVAKNKIDAEITEKLIKDIMQQHIISSEEMYTIVQSKFSYDVIKLMALNNLHKNELLYDNNTQYEYGIGVDHDVGVISPYAYLRDLILGQQNFVSKQTNLKKFIIQFTRSAFTEGDTFEDDKWLYCIKTATKLLPSFYKKIVFNSGVSYIDIIQEIIDERGEISGDGDKIVDKYSGYTIKNVAFNTDDDYDDQGFKTKTHDVLEKDITLDILPEHKVIEEKKSEEHTYINNIISAISHSMGINIEPQRDFIVRHTMLTYEKLKKMELSSSRKKRNIENTLLRYILLLTGIYTLIGIQTMTPSIKTKKTYPNCKKSFTGFPFNTDGDYSGMHYIACIMKKMASASKPWNSIRNKKMSVDFIVKTMVSLYNKTIKEQPEIIDKFTLKQQYALEHLEDDVIDSSSYLNKWYSFLPPLNKFTLSSITNIHDIFTRELLQNIKSGNSNQISQLYIINSKIMLFSLMIQQYIQKVISSENVLLETMTGEPFIENVCCNNDSIKPTYNYFTNKNSDIITTNEKVINLAKLYNDTINISRAVILYSNANTKLMYPPIINEFSEHTIYTAFIHYCKFNKNIPLPDDLMRICQSNASGIKLDDTLDDKIKILKSEDKIYNGKSLDVLMSIINRQHIIHLNINKSVDTTKQQLMNLLGEFEHHTRVISPKLIEYLLNLVDHYGSFEKETERSEQYKQLFLYVSEQNEKMKTEIIAFLDKYINVKHSRKQELFDFIRNFNILNLSETSLTDKEINPDIFVNNITFIKNFITNIAKIFPNIILHKVNYDNIKIPKHWNLSVIHIEDIKKFVKKSHRIFGSLFKKRNTRPSIKNYHT